MARLRRSRGSRFRRHRVPGARISRRRPSGGTVDFWQDALTTNDAARFLTIDVLVLGVAVFVLLGVESRRVGIAAAWFAFYLVGSLLVGISTFAPLFLAHRQRRLDATQVAQG